MRVLTALLPAVVMVRIVATVPGVVVRNALGQLPDLGFLDELRPRLATWLASALPITVSARAPVVVPHNFSPRMV